MSFKVHVPKACAQDPYRRRVIAMKRLLHRIKRKKGQTLVEYALILAFIAAVAISILISLSSAVHGIYTNISSSLASAQASH